MPITPVSLAKTNREKEEEVRPFDERPVEDVPDFPYGLTLYLDWPSLQKLGLGRGDFSAGDVFNIAGTARVVGVNAEVINTAVERKMTLQIETLGVEKQGQEANRARTLFGDR